MYQEACSLCWSLIGRGYEKSDRIFVAIALLLPDPKRQGIGFWKGMDED
jgi:hypothetical protein